MVRNGNAINEEPLPHDATLTLEEVLALKSSRANNIRASVLDALTFDNKLVSRGGLEPPTR